MKICFICAERKPLVKGHKVCAACHAKNGRCGRCGFVRHAKVVELPELPAPLGVNLEVAA